MIQLALQGFTEAFNYKLYKRILNLKLTHSKEHPTFKQFQRGRIRFPVCAIYPVTVLKLFL